MYRTPIISCVALLVACSISMFAACNQPSGGDSDAGDSATSAAPAPPELLRTATDYLGELPAARFHMAMNYRMQGPGLNYDMTTTTAVRFERPNRLAAVVEEGIMGATVVCDGVQVVQHVPALNRYTIDEAPSKLSELDVAESGMLGGAMNIVGASAYLGGDALYDQMMEGVTDSKYVDRQEIDGIDCHHCQFMQDAMTWDLWVEAGEQPLIRKIAVDMTEQLNQAGGQVEAMFKDGKMEIVLTFTDWDVRPQFDDADFAFTPPDSAEKVDSLMAGLTEEDDGPHPLVGEQAPAFATVDLNDNPIELQKHLGQDVVILDFWATWCGPCVDAMPIISKVAQDFADQGVVFYAVNVDEESDVVTEFLESEELDVPVALDPGGEISSLFQANAIPQTVLIGKDGKVQVVHVGFSGSLEEQLTEVLESLVEGEDLAAATLAEAEEKQQQRQAKIESEGVESVWSAKGRWSGVAVDRGQREVYAIDHGGNVAIFNAEGQLQRELALNQAGSVLRCATLIGDAAPELVAFQPWGAEVRAYDADGSELWNFAHGQGVDDVWAADLNGDGMDEVIIGYNGATGLQVLDNQGAPLWKYTRIGNVWHVCAGDFDGDGENNVLTTSAQGKLHVFDAVGNSLKDHDISIYANMVRVKPSSGDDDPCLAILGGSASDGEALVAVDSAGQEHWSVSLPGSAHIDSAAVADDAPWAAVGMRGDVVYVVDVNEGRIVAQLSGAGQRSQVEWVGREGRSPLLLVATGSALDAWEVMPDVADESD